MNKQFELLTWIYDNRDNFPMGNGQIFENFKEDKDYGGSQGNLSELLTKLKNKGRLEKPEYGKYDITDKGENIVENYRQDGNKELVRPENYGEVVRELEEYLVAECSSDVSRSQLEPEDLKISLQEIDRFNSWLLEEFFSDNPEQFIDALQDALEQVSDSKGFPDFSLVPDLEWLEKDLSQALNSKSLGKPLIVEGMIRVAEHPSSIVVSAIFECVQCGDRYEKEQDSGALKSPYKCDCGSKKFKAVDKDIRDVIDLEISQMKEKELSIEGRIIQKTLDKETIFELLSGTRVKLLAKPVLLDSRHKKQEKREKRLKVFNYQRVDAKKDVSEIDKEKKEKVLEKIQKSDDPYEDFARSIAPHIGDMDTAKKCVTASLIGSPTVEEFNSDGRIHTAIISNPGLGKSQVQKWVEENIQKTHRIEGQNSTKSGLTATAEQTQGGEWRLIAGKLVFAHKGILLIDEFDKFPEGELTSLNTAIEEGEFNISKAGKNAKLPGEATIIASGNFAKSLGKYDEEAYKMLPEKGQGLYDRFALLCAVTDSGDEAQKKISTPYLAEDEMTEAEKGLNDVPFDEDELRVFRHLARNYEPRLSRDALNKLKEYNKASKSAKKDNLRGESNRSWENLIKITLAVARANLREKATVKDADKAVKLDREAKASLDLDLGDEVSQELEKSLASRKVESTYEKIGGGEPVSIQNLKDRAVSNHEISAQEFEEVIRNKKNQGEFYEPEPGMVAKL